MQKLGRLLGRDLGLVGNKRDGFPVAHLLQQAPNQTHSGGRHFDGGDFLPGVGQMHAQADQAFGYVRFDGLYRARGFMRKHGLMLRGDGGVDGGSRHGGSSLKAIITQKLEIYEIKEIYETDAKPL